MIPVHPEDLAPDPAAPLPELPGHSSRGRLERVLRRGEFAVTAELNSPDSANPEDVYERARIFEGWVDAINATDGSGAAGTDDYLAEWRRADPVPCGDDLEAEAQAAAERLEAEYDKGRLAALAASGGRERP